MTKAMQLSRLSILAASLALLLVLWGCGSSGDAEMQPTPTMEEPATVPAATLIPTQDTNVELQPTATLAEPPTVPAVTPIPTPEPTDIGEATEKYEGVTYVVSDGTEATFTVEEQLVRLPLPNDAVMRTTELSGEVHLDGRPSVVRIDLQTLESDQAFRDRYVRTRMFGEHPTGIFTVPDIGPIPEGLASGEEVMTSVSGSLEMRGETFPLEFEIEARDDGEVLYVLGRTTFTWDQLNIPRPTAPPVASIEDDVRVEILLALTPEES